MNDPSYIYEMCVTGIFVAKTFSSEIRRRDTPERKLASADIKMKLSLCFTELISVKLENSALRVLDSEAEQTGGTMWKHRFSSCSGGNKESAKPKAGGTKLNNVVFLLHDPGPHPDVELVFIHGFQFTEDGENAFWTTWLSGDGTTCWPTTRLQRAEDFPVAARVLSLKYDASAWKSPTKGRFDLDSLGESLLQQMYLQDARIGQNKCPVVFVCHSLGGIFAKRIFLTAKYQFARDERAQNLLRNLKGFFYATPHSGSKLFHQVCKVPSARRGPLLPHVKELDTWTHRLNSEFMALKNREDEWRFFVAAESCDTVVNGVTVKAVKYASARHLGIDNFVEVPGADHFTVCRPASKDSTSFLALKEFVEEIHDHFPSEAGQLV